MGANFIPSWAAGERSDEPSAESRVIAASESRMSWRSRQSQTRSAVGLQPLAGQTLRDAFEEVVGSFADANAEFLGPSRTEWNVELLRELDWRQLERICTSLYDAHGYVVERGTGTSGGAEIHCLHPDTKRPLVLVQARNEPRPLDGKSIRTAITAASRLGFANVVVISMSGFEDRLMTDSPQTLDLVDAEELLRRIAQLHDGGDALLAEIAGAPNGWEWTSPENE